MRILAASDVHGRRPVYDWLLRVAQECHVDDPTAEPSVVRLLSEQRMIMDGRFLQVEDRSPDGSYSWRAVHGYDPVRRKYISVGISNRSNIVSIAEGAFDDRGNYVLHGPLGETNSFKGVLTIVGPNEMRYVNYRLGRHGEETKYREVIYSRRSGSPSSK